MAVVGLSFTSTVRNTPLRLVSADVARILGIPYEGWDHYVKLEWPPLPNHSSALAISRKFSSKPNLTHHRCVEKNEISLVQQLYFNVVHKIIIQRKLRRTQANFLDLTIMELLDTEVLIDLPSLIIKNMHMVLNQEKHGHAFLYGFWMASIFEAFDMPVQVWHSQIVKDVVGQVNHMALPASMRHLDTPLQRLQNQLAERENELVVMTTAHQMVKENWEARVVTLQNELAQERATNCYCVPPNSATGYSSSHLIPLNSSFLLVSMIHSAIFVLSAVSVLSL
ncbi:hypothetical protein KY284_030359 [Solanum tuberosum]|nr:hypothetical protein KY284_030359 [Solanum tuberosum]